MNEGMKQNILFYHKKNCELLITNIAITQLAIRGANISGIRNLNLLLSKGRTSVARRGHSRCI